MNTIRRIRSTCVGLMTTVASLALAAVAADRASAAVPTLGGLMNHVNVGIEPITNPAPGEPTFRFVATMDDFKPQGETMVPPGETFDPPFDVLHGKAYNAQYGWLRSGRWGVPIGQTMVIEQFSASAGLETYEGGLGADAGGTGLIDGSPHSLAPLFGTNGSASTWDWGTANAGLTMTHHWVATQTPGPHFATYALYVRDDATGTLSTFYEPGTITLRWDNPITWLAGDFNGSGAVEQGDLDLVLNNWGQSTAQGSPAGWIGAPPTELINQDELDAVLNHWGTSASPNVGTVAVPEPAMLLPVCAAFAFSRWRRR